VSTHEEDYELMALLESLNPKPKKKRKKKSKACIWCYERSDPKTMNGDECKECAKMPFCLKCEHDGRTDAKMVKRTNGRTGKKFWGCSRFPQCRFTMELDCKTSTNKASQEFLSAYGPSVSQTQEEQMAFEKDKWYIIHKPSAGTVGEIPEGRVTWAKGMDEFDNKIVQILRHEDLAAHVVGDKHEWAFHIDWAEGPFETKEDALRSQIKISEPRECSPENQEVTCYMAKKKVGKSSLSKIRDRWKNKKASKEAKEKYDEWLKGRPVVGTPEWHEAQNPPSAGDLRLGEDKNGIFTEVFDGERWRIVSDGANAELAPILKTKLGVVGFSGHNGSVATGDMIMPEEAVEISFDGPSQGEFNTLRDQVEALVASKKKTDPIDRFLSDKAIERKYQKDIDKLFNDYHERNRRREELTKRIDSELGKNKTPKRSWKNPAILAGCFAAIAGSAVVLYPYVGGLIQTVF
jgi:ssDNA-binding Zn-finger/Zn-ribbon topoisomerase 1